MKRFLFVTGMAAALMVPALFAQDSTMPPPAQKTGRIQARKRAQQKRIAGGIQSGQLTPAEAARLESKEAKLNRDIRRERAANGGSLTPAEKRQVNRRQNRLSRQIYKEKHDGQTVKP